MNSVGEALRQISMEGAAAAEDRLSPLTEVLGAELLQHLDAESLCRLNLCARFFGEDDPTTRRWGPDGRARRSRVEDAARERALNLMDGHVAGLCALKGASSVRQLEQGTFRAFLTLFYKRLAAEGHRRFPYLPDGRTPRPTSRWPKGRHGFQGWFHTLDALEAGPLAAFAAAEAVSTMVVSMPNADYDVVHNAVLAAALEAANRALLARPGEFGVLVKRRHPAVGDDEERIAALLARHGGLRWEPSKRVLHTGLSALQRATFRSLRHAIDAKDALNADEALKFMSAGSEWNRFFA